MDLFGENFVMKLDEGRDKNYSFMGVLLSFIFLATLSVFTYSKSLAWQEKQDVDVMGAIVENAFDYSDKFSAEEGLFIAAAITEYDNNTEVLEEAKYGELIIKHFDWGHTDGIKSVPKPLSYHWCSDKELGITRSDNTQIYPVYESSLSEVLTYRKKFKCIDPQDMVIWGDFNSKKAQQIRIEFEMCVDNPICESKENI